MPNLVSQSKRLLNSVRNLFLFHIRYPWIKYGADVHVQWSTKFWSPNKRIQIGDHVGIGYRCEINTDLEIGSHVLIGSRVGLLARDAHSINVIGATVFDAPRGDRFEIVIEDDVWIGFGAIILSGVRIGRGSVIGAGAVIHKDVPPYSIVVPPAMRFVRPRFTQDEIVRHEEELSRKGILPESTVSLSCQAWPER
jgi:acetyltransferase-like isoleucine patch superfamily enzyme